MTIKIAGLMLVFAHIVSTKDMPNGTLEVDMVNGKTNIIAKDNVAEFSKAYARWSESQSEEYQIKQKMMIEEIRLQKIDESIPKYFKQAEAFIDTLMGKIGEIRDGIENKCFTPETEKMDFLGWLAGTIKAAEFIISKTPEVKKWITAAKKIEAKYAQYTDIEELPEEAAKEIQEHITDYQRRMMRMPFNGPTIPGEEEEDKP